MPTNNNNLHLLTIQYNDKTVKIDPYQPFPIKWTNGKNARTKLTAESKKAKNRCPDLPTVSFRRVEPLPRTAVPIPFKMPTSYVQCATEEEGESAAANAGADGDSSRTTEYDLDREDLAWLQLANARRRQMGQPTIDDNTLEKAIDMLEKESHFQFLQDGPAAGCGLGYLTMVDNDAPCSICNDGEDSNANQIIFCDICNIAVHQECYGVPYIPEGQWLCRRCQMSPSVPVDCALCPCTSGAFKQTSDGRWAHVVCAIWLNEVHFANTVFLEPVEGVDFSIKRRHKLTCLICKRKVGACLQCSNKACVRSFHATCARYAGLKMVVKESRARNNSDSITINRFAYCFQHSNPNRNGQSVASWKREMEAKLKAARKMIDLNAKQTLKLVPMPVIPTDKVLRIGQQLGLTYIKDIFSYWSLKRKSRFGVPLIRRLQVYMNQHKPVLGAHPFVDGGVTTTAAAAAVGSVAELKPPKKAANAPPSADYSTAEAAILVKSEKTAQSFSGQQEPSKCLAALRRNFERVRLLCELVKKREKLKLDQLSKRKAIACTTLRPLAVLIDQTLTKLIAKDHQKVFTEPFEFSRPEVPSSSSSSSTVNQSPLMDFHQMRANSDRGKYKRIVDLRDDFLLMIRNFTTFNRDSTSFYNYAQRIKRIGMTVLKAAETEEQRMSEFSNLKAQALAQFAPLSNETFANLRNEFFIHCNLKKRFLSQTEMAAVTMDGDDDDALLDTEEKRHLKDTNNNGQKKSADTSSSSSISIAGRAAPATRLVGKKSAAAAKNGSTPSGIGVGRIGNNNTNNNNILSEQEKDDGEEDKGGGDAGEHPSSSGTNSRLRRNPPGKGKKTARVVAEKEKMTTRTAAVHNLITTPLQPSLKKYNNGTVDEHQQQMSQESPAKKRRSSAASTTRTNNNNTKSGDSGGRTMRRNTTTITTVAAATRKGQQQQMRKAVPLPPPLLPQQQQQTSHRKKDTATGAVVIASAKNTLIRKQNYVNAAYQTETSSAAESDSGHCDDDDDDLLLYTLMPEDDDADDLPTTLGAGGAHLNGKKQQQHLTKAATTPRRRVRRVTTANRNKKLVRMVDHNAFDPPSPGTSSSFTHNDIVMVQDIKFPGRVFDIRMRALDLEEEEEDDNDVNDTDFHVSGGGGNGRRRHRNNNNNNNAFNKNNKTNSSFCAAASLERHFVDHALRNKPSPTQQRNNNGMGDEGQQQLQQQQYTLIMFFDNDNTCQWVPNDQIRLLYTYDLLNNKRSTDQDSAVVEAFERAKHFCKSFMQC